MKAEKLNIRPDYKLMKQSDTASYNHFRLPRWLLEDARYIHMSLEAKFIYTLLLNRFQLSKHNGWVNEYEEVFIIYTRKELSERLNVSEKRISSAMTELKDSMLIWERRCGRGFANQIYLAYVEIAQEAPKTDSNSSVGSENRENESQATKIDTNVNYETNETNENEPRTAETAAQEPDIFRTANIAVQEPPNHPFKNRQNDVSRTAEMEVLEPPICPPSYIDLSFKDLSSFDQSQSKSSQSMSSPSGSNTAQLQMTGRRRTDTEAINELLDQVYIEGLYDDDADVISDAIERLYFMQSIRVGNAVYPNERIRAHLQRLDALIAQSVLYRLGKNKTKIRNSSAYVVTVLFNTIMEYSTDMIVDPYLNFLNSEDCKLQREGG